MLPGVVVFRGETGPECPFWSEDGVGLDYSLFPQLSPDLVATLISCCNKQWDIEDDSAGADVWMAEGRRLFTAVANCLPPSIELRWDNDA